MPVLGGDRIGDIADRHSFNDALSWGARLIGHGILGVVTPLRDVHRLSVARGRSNRTSIGAVLTILAPTFIGGGVFLALFASANPLIRTPVRRSAFPTCRVRLGTLAFWIQVLLVIWPNFRPRNTVLSFGSGAAGDVPVVPDVPLATLTLSLFTFDAVFAIQNGLDLAFL